MTVISSFTVDTNILIYSIDRSNPAKQIVADRLLRLVLAKRFPLPMQCLTEFYRATTRKRLLTPAEASDFIHDILIFIAPTPYIADDLNDAMQLHATNGIQFFDALILATSSRAGCSILFSEDLQDNRSFGSLTVRNPFLMDSTVLDALIA